VDQPIEPVVAHREIAEVVDPDRAPLDPTRSGKDVGGNL
jgi:hypothetical protein